MNEFSRRDFLKNGTLTAGALAMGLSLKGGPALAAPPAKAKVFFTRDLSAEGLLNIYAKVNEGMTGKVALKLHTGEPNGPNILPRPWVQRLQASIPDSAIVECNVLYESPRQTTEGHRETLKTNGWTFCAVDIMDAEGDVSLPVPGGRRLKEVAVGKHLLNYDSLLAL